MTFKNDFVVWLFLSDTQLNIYRDFLELSAVKEVRDLSLTVLVCGLFNIPANMQICLGDGSAEAIIHADTLT